MVVGGLGGSRHKTKCMIGGTPGMLVGTIRESSRTDVLMQVANTSSNYINNVKLRIIKTFFYSHSSACYNYNLMVAPLLNTVVIFMVKCIPTT